MSVLINLKICDNSEDCTGIQVCPTEAFFWDDENRTIAVNEDECILCDLCEEACLVGAIKVAHNQDEYDKVKQEIEADPRKVTDLFVDRYGAMPIQPEFLTSQDKFDIQVLRSTKLTIVEFFNDESIECLISSIPIKELLENVKVDLMYRKMEAKSDTVIQTYGLNELPALLFFNDGKLIGKIEGYYDNEMKQELINQISAIVTVHNR